MAAFLPVSLQVTKDQVLPKTVDFELVSSLSLSHSFSHSLSLSFYVHLLLFISKLQLEKQLGRVYLPLVQFLPFSSSVVRGRDARHSATSQLSVG